MSDYSAHVRRLHDDGHTWSYAHWLATYARAGGKRRWMMRNFTRIGRRHRDGLFL